MRRRRSDRAGALSPLTPGSPGRPTDCAPAPASPQPDRAPSAPSPEVHFSAPTARDGAPASHRDGRCARQPRRGERAYRLYASEPQRRMTRCSARRMQRAPRHGLTGRGAAGPMWLGRREAPLREGRRAKGEGRAKGKGRSRCATERSCRAEARLWQSWKPGVWELGIGSWALVIGSCRDRPYRPSDFSLVSLNSFPAFHSGNFSAFATR